MRIEHIALWVTDLEAMRSFYESYFGAKAGPYYHNSAKQFSSYFLSFQDGARLEIMHRPDIHLSQDAIPKIGLAHFAISVGSEEAVNQLTNRLRADGFQILDGPRRTGDGYYESVVLDPENNRVEVTI